MIQRTIVNYNTNGRMAQIRLTAIGFDRASAGGIIKPYLTYFSQLNVGWSVMVVRNNYNLTNLYNLKGVNKESKA